MATNNMINTPIPFAATVGGTGQSTYSTGDTLYASASNTVSRLSGNASATQAQLLSMINSVPSWLTLNNINVQTGTTYKVALSDYGCVITLNNASAITVTLPQQSDTATSAGFFCWLYNIGSGLVTVVKQGAESLYGNTTLGQYAEMKVERLTTTVWSTFGGTATVNTEYNFFMPTATANQVGYFSINASYAGTILSCSQQATSFGTAGTYTISINGSSVTGLTTVTNTTSITTTSASGANTFTVGSVIAVTLSAAVATGVNVAYNLNCTRTY